MLKIFSPIVFCVALLVLPARAQDVVVDAQTDSASYEIGQWITLHVHSSASPSVVALAPVFRDSIGSFEVLGVDSAVSEEREGRREKTWTFRLTTFDSGAVTILPIPFLYKTAGFDKFQSVSTPPVPLTIRTVAVNLSGDIRDVKPPLSAPWRLEDFLTYLPWLILALVLVVAAYIYVRRKRKPAAELEAIRRIAPPHEIALSSLRQIEEKKLWQQGRVKEFYSDVTEVVRWYLGTRFAVLALEVTSDELLAALGSAPEAQPIISPLRSMLTTADLVKFAKYLPAPEENGRTMMQAYEIVRAVVPRPTEATVEKKEEPVDAG